MRGPIDFIIVGFEGNKFTGEILKELKAAADKGIVDVLALAVVAKDKDGAVTTLSLSDDVLKVTKTLNLSNDMISDEDVDEVGDLLENNTAAGLLIVEHLWAKGLKKAIKDAGGTLIADGRIHPDASEELNKEGK